MKKLSQEDILPIVHGKLRARYGAIEVVSGKGIARGQRVEFSEQGKRVRCVIKTSSSGRISFGHRDDGTWSGLSESDRVIVVAPSAFEGKDLVVIMFDQKVLVDAFEQNLAAQKQAGMENLPCWLAPFHEDGRGPRGTGDGFADRSLWSEPLDGIPTSTINHATNSPAPAVRGLTLAEAKEGLARTFGVSPDAIEITIRG